MNCQVTSTLATKELSINKIMSSTKMSTKYILQILQNTHKNINETQEKCKNCKYG